MTRTDSIGFDVVLDHLSSDPRVALEAMDLIEQARGWLADCQWQDMDEDDFGTLGTLEIVRGVHNHYCGGWYGFVAACG